MTTLFGCALGPASLFTIDPATGVRTLVGNTGFDLNCFTSDNLGTLYAAANQTGFPLITIDPQTGAGTFVGDTQPPTQIVSLAFSPENILFGISTESQGLQRLVTIDVTSRAVTAIGQLNSGVQSLQTLWAIAFASDGTLYGFGQHLGLVTINTSTAAVTQIYGPTGPVPNILVFCLCFAPDGTLFGGANVLWKFDLAARTVQQIGSDGHNGKLNGMAFRKSPVLILPKITPVAWLWMILIGYILLTPIGPICIACGNPLSDVTIRILGAVTILFAGLGLWAGRNRR